MARVGTDEGVTHTLSSGQEVVVPPHEEFYEQFTTRNRGLIPDEEQQRLRTAGILIAGCGSIGGAAVEPLIRLGAENLTLVEPDDYDIGNLNRQSVRLQDVGRNKASALKEQAGDINPYARVEVDTRGVAAENVEALVAAADLILDGVDVTTRPPLKHKFALHAEAKRGRVPVVSGYDIAGLQLLLIYDYREDNVPVLNGKVKPDEVERLEPFEFLARVVPIPAIPLEMIPELRKQLRGERVGFPQIVYTAHLFGVLAVRAALDLLAGRPVRRRVMVDVNKLMRPVPHRLRLEGTRWRDLYRLNRESGKLRRSASVEE